MFIYWFLFLNVNRKSIPVKGGFARFNRRHAESSYGWAESFPAASAWFKQRKSRYSATALIRTFRRRCCCFAWRKLFWNANALSSKDFFHNILIYFNFIGLNFSFRFLTSEGHSIRRSAERSSRYVTSPSSRTDYARRGLFFFNYATAVWSTWRPEGRESISCRHDQWSSGSFVKEWNKPEDHKKGG